MSERVHSSRSSWQGNMWQRWRMQATRTPLILLLGAKPPVLVRGRGRMRLEDAISSELESVLRRANNEQLALEEMVERIPDVFCWITWPELSDVIAARLRASRQRTRP